MDRAAGSVGPPIERNARVTADPRTDENLMEALCRGEKTALAEIVRRYQSDIFRFCVHYLRESERAREIAQETFLRVYTARARFDGTRKFRPWVLCIARNLCLNDLKRKKAVPMESLEQYASSAREDTGELMPTSADGPDEVLAAGERRQMLARMLEELEEDARELLVLRFFQRMSAKEIADIVGSTEGAVRTRLHRLLRGLQKKYADSRDYL
jgi:RNA polymerase sigma-70 factor (ECF subfamily)